MVQAISGFARRHWRKAVVGAVVAWFVLLVGACTSGVYLHTMWEKGTQRCERLHPEWGGANYGFDGAADEFECMARDAKGRTLASDAIPVEDVMGRSGGWPWFPALVAYGLEDIDGDSP